MQQDGWLETKLIHSPSLQLIEKKAVCPFNTLVKSTKQKQVSKKLYWVNVKMEHLELRNNEY